MIVTAKTVKICSKNHPNTNATNEADFFNEISVMSHVRHPNLVLFLGACLDDSVRH